MKVLLSFAAFFLCSIPLFAQDIITKKDGTDIKAKVTEIDKNNVSFKKFSNLDGPTYKLDVADILMITYENGEREMYNVESYANKSDMPSGIMTYNSWSGKVSVGGITIENEMLGRFFTPEDLKLYNNGKALSTVGGIVSIVGAIPFGYGIGYIIGWNIGGGGTPPSGPYQSNYNAAKIMALVGGVLFAVGLGVNIPGESKIKRAVNNYNSALTYHPSLHLGATDNGIGLAYVF